MKTITIIGSGMMGSALAFPARENGNRVRLVGTPLDREIIDACRRTRRHPKFDRDFPDGVEYYQFEEVRTALDGTDFVIGGVSSFGVEWFGREVLPILPPGVPVLSVTKGLQDLPDGRLLCYPQLWQRRLDELGKDNSLNAIGGPCTSYELVAHDHSLVAFCGASPETLAMMRDAMATDYYHVMTTGDVIGLESAVALKNGYALGIALTIGENIRRSGNPDEIHYNSQAAVFLQATREMDALVRMQGGSPNSFYAGIGDLYVTVYGGRTRKVGILLGEGYDIDEALAKLQGVTLESLVVARRVATALRTRAARGLVRLEDFPLLMHVDDIISRHQPVNLPWTAFASAGSDASYRPRLVGHRGSFEAFTENGLHAFQYAITNGINAFETDFRMTADGVIVLMHDSSIERTTTGKGNIEHMTLEQLRKVKLRNSDETIPTAGEFFSLIAERNGFYLELEMKAYYDNLYPSARMDEYLDKLYDAARPRFAANIVIFTSFSPDVLRRMKERHPDANIGLICEALDQPTVDTALAIGCRCVAATIDGTTKPLVDQLKAAGLLVNLWHADTLERWQTAQALGADVSTCNRPVAVLNAVTSGK